MFYTSIEEDIVRTGFVSPFGVALAIVPATALVAVENTHNGSGGRIFPFAQLKGVVEAARERGLRLHLDGARLFNAVVATGISAADWARPCPSPSSPRCWALTLFRPNSPMTSKAMWTWSVMR